MSTFTFTTAAGTALVAAAFVLVSPALASADTASPAAGDTTTSTDAPGSTTVRSADPTPDRVAQDIARFKSFKEAIRNGTADSTAPIVGKGGGSPLDSIPAFNDIADFTGGPILP